MRHTLPAATCCQPVRSGGCHSDALHCRCHSAALPCRCNSAALPVPQCCTLVQSCCTLAQPCCTLVQPCCTLVQPCCTLVQPCCTLVQPCCTLVQPCCTLVQPCCALNRRRMWPVRTSWGCSACTRVGVRVVSGWSVARLATVGRQLGLRALACPHALRQCLRSDGQGARDRCEARALARRHGSCGRRSALGRTRTWSTRSRLLHPYLEYSQ